MNYLRVFLPVLIILVALNTNAQNCKEKEAGINTSIKAGNYSSAYIQWTDARGCLAESEAFYSIGEKILNNRIDNAPADQKDKLISGLLDLYASYDKNFPVNKNGNAVKRAMAMHKHKIGKPDEIYNSLRNAFNNERASFTDPKALHTYFEIVYKAYQNNEHGIAAEDVYGLHDNIIAWTSELKKSAKSPGSYKSVADGINSLMAPIATCDKLVPYYEKTYSSRNSDKNWLETAATTLSARNCTSAKVFLDIAAQWYLLSPDAKSAFNLGMANIRNKNTQKGVEYFNKAAELEKNPDEKSLIYYSIATLLNSDKAEAIKFLRKAIGTKPSFGKAYLLMGQMYAGAGNECGISEFDKKAIYLLASQTAEKAGAVDPTLKSAAKQLSEMYLKKGPTAEEIKQNNAAGKTIAFQCWINDSVVIPGKQ